jgi:hypothetical protein
MEFLMKCISTFILLMLLPVSVMAEVKQEHYPELMVVPKASERLMLEARREEQNAWTNHLPLNVASATTLLAGIMTLNDLDKENDPEGIKPKIAIAVGAGWLATSLWLQTSYRPYRRGAMEVKKASNQNNYSRLMTERLAEEHIDQAARLAKKIKWLSFITNAGASALLIDSANKDSAAQGVAILGTVTSFLPLLFPLSWEQVSEDQQSYKKKVFGPVTFSNGLLINPANQQPTLGLVVGTYFN